MYIQSNNNCGNNVSFGAVKITPNAYQELVRYLSEPAADTFKKVIGEQKSNPVDIFISIIKLGNIPYLKFNAGYKEQLANLKDSENISTTVNAMARKADRQRLINSNIDRAAQLGKFSEDAIDCLRHILDKESSQTFLNSIKELNSYGFNTQVGLEAVTKQTESGVEKTIGRIFINVSGKQVQAKKNDGEAVCRAAALACEKAKKLKAASTVLGNASLSLRKIGDSDTAQNLDNMTSQVLNKPENIKDEFFGNDVAKVSAREAMNAKCLAGAERYTPNKGTNMENLGKESEAEV